MVFAATAVEPFFAERIKIIKPHILYVRKIILEAAAQQAVQMKGKGLDRHTNTVVLMLQQRDNAKVVAIIVVSILVSSGSIIFIILIQFLRLLFQIRLTIFHR